MKTDSEIEFILGFSSNKRKEFGHHEEEGHDDHDDDHDDDDHDDDDHDDEHGDEAIMTITTNMVRDLGFRNDNFRLLNIFFQNLKN